MQTILGSGGDIGTGLAKALAQFTPHIRLVSRNPQKVNDGDQLLPADLTRVEEVDRAVAGSEVVYLTIGFEYKVKVWRKNWPKLMRNVIDACKKHGAKLVFFDNVYMYDPAYMHCMTEETPIRPVSKKGKIRAEVAEMLLSEVRAGQLTALIARSADFLGLKNSVPVEMGIKNFLKGKKAFWMVDVDKIHSFTYTPDAAKATALLGNTPDAYGQVWHLPTDKTPLTGKQWIDLMAEATGATPGYSVLPKWLMGILGIFVPVMKEFKEMAYQNDRDYFFDSSKFEKRFDLKPTSPEQAVKEVIAALKAGGTAN